MNVYECIALTILAIVVVIFALQSQDGVLAGIFGAFGCGIIHFSFNGFKTEDAQP
jgi:hypothetical protein